VESEQNGVPRLDDVVVVYNGTAYHSGSGDPSLDAALCQITNPGGGRPFSSYCSGGPEASTPTTQPAQGGPSTTTTTTPAKSGPTTTGPVKSGSSSTTTSSPPSSSSATTTLVLPTPHSNLSHDLAGAQQDFADAKAALHQGDLATYQQDIAAGEALVAQADKLAQGSTTTVGTTTGTTTTGTTTTVPAAPTSTTRPPIKKG
jgi:hypothetical protein